MTKELRFRTKDMAGNIRIVYATDRNDAKNQAAKLSKGVKIYSVDHA